MTKRTKWTPWMENPLAAALKVADENGMQRATVTDVMLRIPEWQSFDAEYFLDDLLQEIAGDTDIVVQYDTDRALFRAALDQGED